MNTPFYDCYCVFLSLQASVSSSLIDRSPYLTGIPDDAEEADSDGDGVADSQDRDDDNDGVPDDIDNDDDNDGIPDDDDIFGITTIVH